MAGSSPAPHGHALPGNPVVAQGAKNILVILKTGKSDKGTAAVLAFSLGLSSRASLGIDTTLFLVGEGAVWAVQGASKGISVAGFPPLAQLIDDFQAAGGKVVVCSTCTESFCTVGKGSGRRKAPLIPGAQLVGFTYISRLMVTSASTTF